MSKVYPNNLANKIKDFNKIFRDFLELNEKILYASSNEIDEIVDGNGEKKYKVIKGAANLYKRQYHKDLIVEVDDGDSDDEDGDIEGMHKRIYDTHFDLFVNIYNNNADAIASDEIDDTWLVDTKLKLWIGDNTGNRKKSSKTGLGYMICISDIYRYSLEVVTCVDKKDEETKYPDMYLLYLYQPMIFCYIYFIYINLLYLFYL